MTGAMLYHAQFIGRTKGAIGIDYPIRHFVRGDDPEAARINLYEWFDHVLRPTFTPMVLRYIAVGEGGENLQANQGRYTYATQAEAQAVIDTMIAANDRQMLIGLFGDPDAYHPEARWCWPGHFDPAVGADWPHD